LHLQQHGQHAASYPGQRGPPDPVALNLRGGAFCVAPFHPPQQRADRTKDNESAGAREEPLDADDEDIESRKYLGLSSNLSRDNDERLPGAPRRRVSRTMPPP
jgi:hypothetical protein